MKSLRTKAVLLGSLVLLAMVVTGFLTMMPLGSMMSMGGSASSEAGYLYVTVVDNSSSSVDVIDSSRVKDSQFVQQVLEEGISSKDGNVSYTLSQNQIDKLESELTTNMYSQDDGLGGYYFEYEGKIVRIRYEVLV